MEFGLPLHPISLRPDLKMIKKSTWIILFLLIPASACLDEPDCYSLNNYIIGISFRKLADSTADTVGFTSIRIANPEILFKDDTVSKIYIPLNYFQNETTFLFDHPDNTQILRLGYTSQVQFVSEGCGERFVLSNLRVLEHSFDSIRILTTNPSREAGTTHLEIFQ